MGSAWQGGSDEGDVVVVMEEPKVRWGIAVPLLMVLSSKLRRYESHRRFTCSRVSFSKADPKPKSKVQGGGVSGGEHSVGEISPLRKVAKSAPPAKSSQRVTNNVTANSDAGE